MGIQLLFKLESRFHRMFIQRIQHQRNVAPREGSGDGIYSYFVSLFGVRNRLDTYDDPEHCTNPVLKMVYESTQRAMITFIISEVPADGPRTMASR